MKPDKGEKKPHEDEQTIGESRLESCGDPAEGPHVSEAILNPAAAQVKSISAEPCPATQRLTSKCSGYFQPLRSGTVCNAKLYDCYRWREWRVFGTQRNGLNNGAEAEKK